MVELNRRRFLQLSGTLAGAAALAACGSDSADRNYLTWWDHQGNQRTLHQQIFGRFRKAGGMRVQYTFRNAEKMGQALQLAKQSNQLPDVHTNAGLVIPVPALIKAGWVAPLDLGDAAMARLKGHLVDGVHVFDGKVYSFPNFNFRSYQAATWFNTRLVAKAGLDPDDPPRTYDEFRAAVRRVGRAGGDDTYGWVWNAGMTQRMEDQVNNLAQAAGFEGAGGTLYRTGEFAYHSEPYLTAIEFLVSMARDKLILPGSNTFDDQIARSKWVAGSAGYFIDGPWCPGVIRESFPEFSDSLGVGPILTPEAGTVRCYAPPLGGDFWLSPTAADRQQKAANRLLGDYFTTEEYYVDLAGWMPQPPLDLSAVAKSNAYPSWKKLVGWMAEQVFLGPTPVVKNVQVNKVQAETNEIKPGLGDIVQGALTGDVTDVRKALKDLSDANSKERERALKTAQAQGAKVGLDDYAFPNWRPGKDYGTDQYH